MHNPAGRPDAAQDADFVLQPATLAEPRSFSPAAATRDHTETEEGAGAELPAQRAAQTVQDFLDQVLTNRLVGRDDLETFLHNRGELDDADLTRLTAALVEQGLLTDYQVQRLRAGRTFGLVLGNYRILDRLGSGGMGVVYKAEHIYLKRPVAVKVLIQEDGRSPLAWQRFSSEMQATAALQHPNIVTAFDAGEAPLPNGRGVLHYLAMEYVPGRTLDVLVQDHGPLPAARACGLICQAAQGLQHAHERGLVHRDIKPSNLVLTPQEQIKLLDFGLAQLCRRRHTEAFALLGTLDYVAPEQARDARSADIRADIYGLGGTLYWLLTGRKPFPGQRPPLEELLARQREKPVPLRQMRPDLPAELEAVLARMLAHDPDDRYATPRAVVSALTPFQEISHPLAAAAVHAQEERPRPRRVLLVSARPGLRAPLRAALADLGLEGCEAESAEEASERVARAVYDAVLIDMLLPDHAGLRLCHQLREAPLAPHPKVLLLTTEDHAGQRAAGQKVSAADAAPAALPPSELAARTQALLRLKEAEEHAARLAGQLARSSRQLDQAQRRCETDLDQAQEVLLFALIRMTELRGLETAAHLARLQGYVRVLAEEALRLPAFAGRIDETFARLLERCVPLHDLGKVALPDHVLLKPGKLDDEERAIMESHAALGADILTAAARQHGAPLAFLQTAAAIARHHHERFDGTGYPDALAGEAIPLAARFVTVTDVYDALRSKLVYKPGLSHAAACRLILEKSPGQFDPAVLLAFRRCEASFAQIFAQRRD